MNTVILTSFIFVWEKSVENLSEVDVNEIMHQIEVVMSQAKADKAKARLGDFKGISNHCDLAKLMEYNKEKQNIEMEKVKDVRVSVLEKVSEPFSKDVIKKVY